MENPLVTHIYTADPSAHVFGDKIYVYPSHDRETDIQFNDNGDQYDMVDYHVISLDSIDQRPANDHGVALTASDIPWVSKQTWAPDALQNPNTGKYQLYFPARDKDGIFRIGVATSDNPEGPFKAEPEYIKGSFSIDPCSFVDDDKQAYLYIGGLWGGQLQCWSQRADGGMEFDSSKSGPQEPSGEGVAALFPKVGKLRAPELLEFDGGVQDMQILDPDTMKPLLADDHQRRFFEAPWMHKYQGKYYFSYSTGDTHNICYAVGDSPTGPFVYRGKVLQEKDVIGWTTHHSFVEVPKGKLTGEEEGTSGTRWYIFYHSCDVSKGVDHLRSVRVSEVTYDGAGDVHLVRRGKST
ncbi:hypothetical protein LTR70_003484 [Exophiala xenobiotica]|uniref:Uncharacterized protein n=1 Tax=Lithohypha guttulata TaxID=1690604 RepID=A0ABR0KGE3_9EURO|nr:hypothetical protein LTR24_003032 [Lithohypha guttulata]KAK5323022.1 hypothetical protein LTR70_003484 [Exophiala xenobiotica]